MEKFLKLTEHELTHISGGQTTGPILRGDPVSSFAYQVGQSIGNAINGVRDAVRTVATIISDVATKNIYNPFRGY